MSNDLTIVKTQSGDGILQKKDFSFYAIVGNIN